MTIPLRDGTTTEDQRLDRLVQFDERSRNFAAVEVIPQKSRSWTWYNYNKLDQFNEGACVGFSIGHALGCRPTAQYGIDNEYARRIYHEAQRIDPWPGGSYPGASPVYEGTSVLAGVKAAQSMGHFDEYRWCFGLDDLTRSVGYSPAVIGVNWYEGMTKTDAKGYIKPSGSVLGGHAILVAGVSQRLRHFKLWNSWGTDWGRNGACYITFDDMGRLLDERGEAVVLLGKKEFSAR